MTHLRKAVLLSLLLAFGSSGAQAQQQVTLIAPVGAQAAIEALIPGFEASTGYKVKATFGTGLVTKAQIAKGEAFDVPVAQVPFPEILASGNVIVASQKPLASVAVALAVKAGAAKPDISTPAALKKLLLSAATIAYPDPGRGAAAGVSFDKMLKQMGIAEQVEPKLRRAQGGSVAMTMLAKGEVEISFTFQSEMNDPGITIVGPLPREICPPTDLAGFVSAHASDAKVAKALLDYLSSPAAAKAWAAHGMVPAP